MHDTIIDHLQHMVAGMDEQHNGQEQEQPGTTGQETQPIDTIHIHYFPDAIVLVKEGDARSQQDNTVETTLAKAKQPPVFIAYATCVFYLFLVLSCIAFQVYCMLNPPIATVTIVPQSQIVTLTGTVQLGRLLTPLTVSQSQTVPTTGTGHQDARSATGDITLYNGLFTPQTILSGTILSGSNGVQIITDQSAFIPAASPPSLGQTTVPAHTMQTGIKGNIPAYDINTPCCLTAVKVVNTQAFTGGQDARDFSTVSQQDIHTVAIQLLPTLTRSMHGALQGQLTPQEQLHLLACTPTITSDHHIGQEAPTVTISVSETCSAVAYNQHELAAQATGLLSRQAATMLGTAYSLFGAVMVHVTRSKTMHMPAPLVFLSFQASGTWIYALSQRTQQQIKHLIAGKTKPVARTILLTLPGVAQAAIALGDAARLPTGTRNIHIVFVIGAARGQAADR